MDEKLVQYHFEKLINESSESEVFNSLLFMLDHSSEIYSSEIYKCLRFVMRDNKNINRKVKIFYNRIKNGNKELCEKYNLDFSEGYIQYNPDYVFKMLKSEEGFYEMLQEEREMKINKLLE